MPHILINSNNYEAKMNTFDDRKKAFESKFANDAEMQFKVMAKRNKLSLIHI